MKRVLIPLFLLFAMPSMAQHMLVDKVGDNPQIIDFTEFSNITFNGTTGKVATMEVYEPMSDGIPQRPNQIQEEERDHDGIPQRAR